jgi:hypothetical protein
LQGTNEEEKHCRAPVELSPCHEQDVDVEDLVDEREEVPRKDPQYAQSNTADSQELENPTTLGDGLVGRV